VLSARSRSNLAINPDSKDMKEVFDDRDVDAVWYHP